MSFVHCSSCARAYNHARGACPTCAARRPTETVVDAYDAFARAISTATPEQVGTAWAALEARAPRATPATTTTAISLVAALVPTNSGRAIVVDRHGRATRPSRGAKLAAAVAKQGSLMFAFLTSWNQSRFRSA